MNQVLELPAVATNFFTKCKKCDADRYHKVLAHTATGGAKLECEVCKAKSTYKVPKAQARKSNAAPRKKVSVSATAKKNQHEQEYNTLNEKLASKESTGYNMQTKFAIDQVLEHPKFGRGFVRAVQPDKVEVVFQDEVRMLVHNR